jgi:hypothetical protein
MIIYVFDFNEINEWKQFDYETNNVKKNQKNI